MHFRFVREILVFVLLFVPNIYALEETLDLVDQALDQAKKYQDQITLPDSTDTAGDTTAKKAFDRFQSLEVQKKIDDEKDRIKKTVFHHFLPRRSKTETIEDICPDGFQESERLFLFISSSIPFATLRTYIRDLHKLDDPHIVVVLRGFIGGMKQVRPTLDFLENLLKIDPDCHLREGRQCQAYHVNIEIDPLKFQTFGITEVPAVVYVKTQKPMNGQEGMASTVGLFEESTSVVVYGDASLEALLERIFDKTNSPQIKRAIQKLREDFYEG